MAGSMRQRGKDSWNLRVFVGWDPVTRRRSYLERTVRGTRKDASTALAVLVLEAERLSPSAPRKGTLAALCEEWLAHASPGFSPRTVETVRGYLRWAILPALGHVQVSRLTAADLDRFYRRLRAEGGVRDRPYSASTIRRVHGIIRRALTQGVRWGWIASNPAVAASPPRIPHQELRPPSPRVVVRLFSAAKRCDTTLATFILVASSTGARRGELVALRRGDLDLDGALVSIDRGIVIADGALVEQGTKTHQSRRIALDARSVEALECLLSSQDALAAAHDVNMDANPFVFSRAIDGAAPWRPDSASRAFRSLCDREGIDGVRLHDLRHYVATRLLVAGVDVRTVAGRLGHRSPATTLNVYAHFLPGSDRDAADALRDVFDGALVDRTPQE